MRSEDQIRHEYDDVLAQVEKTNDKLKELMVEKKLLEWILDHH